MAAGVAELALDISSFNNVTSDEALIALRSGLIGSAEPLQSFGVDVRVAALQQEALIQGISTSIKEMTEGQRVALRYAAIQRQLGTQGAVGDATRTAEGFANASRNLAAALRETAGMMGTFLLGNIGKLVLGTRELINEFQAWIATNRKVIQQTVDRFLERVGRVISNVWNLLVEITSATMDWIDSLGSLGDQLMSVVKTVAVLAAILLLPGGSILLLIGLIALLIDDFETWRKGGDSVLGDIIDGFKELGLAVEAVWEIVADYAKAFNDWMDSNVVAARALTSGILTLAAAIGVKLVLANKAAIASFVAFRAFQLQYYAVIWAAEAKTLAIRAAAAVKTAALWLWAAAPLVLTIGLVAALGAAIVFVVRDLIAMGKGQESFFGTMAKGIDGLIKKWGGVGGAIGEMLDTALKHWLKFFGLTDDEVKQWVDELTETLGDFWEGTFGRLADLADKIFGDDEGPNVVPAPVAAGAGGGSFSDQSQMTINVDVQAGNADAQGVADLVPGAIAREQERAQRRAAARNFAVRAP